MIVILIHKPIDILNYIKRINSFPNAYIVYRIMLTISVSVALAERSFLKTYTNKIVFKINNVSRLKKLALLFIEKYFLNKINYDNLINTFAS